MIDWLFIFGMLQLIWERYRLFWRLCGLVVCIAGLLLAAAPLVAIALNFDTVLALSLFTSLATAVVVVGLWGEQVNNRWRWIVYLWLIAIEAGIWALALQVK